MIEPVKCLPLNTAPIDDPILHICIEGTACTDDDAAILLKQIPRDNVYCRAE